MQKKKMQPTAQEIMLYICSAGPGQNEQRLQPAVFAVIGVAVTQGTALTKGEVRRAIWPAGVTTP